MSSVYDDGFMKFLTSEVLCSVCERASSAKRFYCPRGEHHVCQDCVVLKFYKAEGASVGGTYPHCPECSVLLEKISSRVISLPAEMILKHLEEEPEYPEKQEEDIEIESTNTLEMSSFNRCQKCHKVQNNRNEDFACPEGHLMCTECVLSLAGFRCEVCRGEMRMAADNANRNNDNSVHQCFMLGCQEDLRWSSADGCWDHLERHHLVEDEDVPRVSKAGIILPGCNDTVFTFERSNKNSQHSKGKVSVAHHLHFDGQDFLVLSKTKAMSDGWHRLVSVVRMGQEDHSDEEEEDCPESDYKVSMEDGDSGDVVYDGPVNSASKGNNVLFRHRADRPIDVANKKIQSHHDNHQQHHQHRHHRHHQHHHQDHLRLRIKIRRDDSPTTGNEIFKFWHNMH